MPSSFDSAFNKDYIHWKNWGSHHFGKFSVSEKIYFDAEINRTEIVFNDKPLRVLEIGFGNGNFLAYAKNRGWDVYGIEANINLIELAKSNGFNVSHADDLKQFQNDSFDLVVAFDVLEHIEQKFLLDFLNEVCRILSDGGVFLARFPNGDSPIGLPNQNGDITHVTAIGSKKVEYFASILGAKLIFIGGQAIPLPSANLVELIYKLVVLPIRSLINLFVKIVFFPRANIAFCSSNLIMILGISKPTQD